MMSTRSTLQEVVDSDDAFSLRRSHHSVLRCSKGAAEGKRGSEPSFTPYQDAKEISQLKTSLFDWHDECNVLALPYWLKGEGVVAADLACEMHA